MSNWLHQFWRLAFESAKHCHGWDRNTWDRPVILLDSHGPPRYHPVQTLGTKESGSIAIDASDRNSSRETVPLPQKLCYWSVHVTEEEYDKCPKYEWQAPPFHERLREAAVANEFSTIDTDTLPVALPRALKEKESAQLLKGEALGFAIMAGNIELVMEILKDLDREEVIRINPLHLAATYLHGAKACCAIFEAILLWGARVVCGESLNTYAERRDFLDSLSYDKDDHHIFDKLMLSILRSHSNVTPRTVGGPLKREMRFHGEEIDICGRWDAESHCYSRLVSSSNAAVPFTWKHKFCHTSIQTVCHCVSALINGRFCKLPGMCGLFAQCCENCGLKMQLTPLHVVVVVALYLAESNLPEEDLFGVIALLLQIMYAQHDLWECDQCEDSVVEYFDLETFCKISKGDLEVDPACCYHTSTSPHGFACSLSQKRVGAWPEKVQLGWKIILQVLRIESTHVVENRQSGHANTQLGVLWEAVQVELLTYRRQSDTQPWISQNFDMEAMLMYLEEGIEIPATPLDDGPIQMVVWGGLAFRHPSRLSDIEAGLTEDLPDLADDYERCEMLPPRGFRCMHI